MTSKDALGDSCKQLEMAAIGSKAMRGLPLLCRLDGRAFSTFTKGLNRPYDDGMVRCMVETTKYLVDETHALVGYTQSDEISLMWWVDEDTTSQFPFDGRFQKLTSVFASMASVKFSSMLPAYLPSKAGKLPVFDCRVWQVPSKKSALSNFVWREDDCLKNSVSSAAQAFYSTKELHKKNSSDKHEMLFQKGINFNDYPAYFKRGTYVKRRSIERLLTEEERVKIPEAHRPDKGIMVTRTNLIELDMPPIRKIQNPIEVLFGDAEPVAISTVTKVLEATHTC